MSDHSTRQAPVTRCWSHLPDGVCEHIAAFLPRIALLSARLVCASWKTAFAHALSPLLLDTRCFYPHSASDTLDTENHSSGPFHSQTHAGGSNAGPLPEPATQHPPRTSPGPPPHPPPPPAPSAAPHPSHDPSWASLLASMAPMRPSFHIAAALLHESKARAKPCEASLHACLAFLSQLPAADLSRLQLQLPLRYPLPDSCLALLLQRGSRLHQQLTSLRLSRVSLTEPLAQGLGALPALRHLCMAHANLIALPQLLAAATQLEHLHVHGYHSLVIVEDNAHMCAVWNAAVALVQRGQGQQGGQQGPGGEAGGGAEAGDAGAGSSAAGAAGATGAAGAGDAPLGESVGKGRGLRCLAITAQHLYQDAVLDETELEFEPEALRWQIRYEAWAPPCPACGGSGARGSPSSWGQLQWRRQQQQHGDASGQGGWRCGGCAVDPHADGGLGGAGQRHPASGTYLGGGAGSANLCAGALVGLACACCCCCSGSTSSSSARHGFGIRSGEELQPCRCVMGGEEVGTGSTALGRWSATGGRRSSMDVPAGPGGDLGVLAGENGGAGSSHGPLQLPLQLLKSGKRDVVLVPPARLCSEVRQPYWQHLQFVQLVVSPPPAAEHEEQAEGQEQQQRQPAQQHLQQELEAGQAGRGLGGAGGVEENGHDGLGAEATEGWPETEGGCPLSSASLAPLSALPSLTGLWLDPDEWEEDEGEQQRQQQQQQQQGGERSLAPAGPWVELDAAASTTALLGPQQLRSNDQHTAPSHTSTAAGPSTSTAASLAAPSRPVCVCGVWTRLHHPQPLPPPHPPAAHAAVQDALGHVRLLLPLRRLHCLALGDRRAPFLGVGDDSAALLAHLTALTRLHLSAAYTLPLLPPPLPQPTATHGVTATGSAGNGSGVAPPADGTSDGGGTAAEAGVDAGWLLHAPARLAPLGGLCCLQRLSLHFGNPDRRPAVVSGACLPPSLTSLSLQGVVLLAGPGAGYEAGTGQGGRPDGGLACLRDLVLKGSFVECADRLGCGGSLRLVSLVDSGCSTSETGQGGGGGGGEGGSGGGGIVEAGDGRRGGSSSGKALARLLRCWYGVQTLRVVGSAATSRDVLLPCEGSLSWYDPPGLRAVATCLPGLRQLQLDPPESACLGAAHELRQQHHNHHGVEEDEDTDTRSAHTSPRWDLTASSTSSCPPPSTTSQPTAAAHAIEPPTCWLRLLLRLLSCHCPHLTSLRVHATAADREGAEAAVRCAAGLLPRRLPRLEQLTLLVDLGQGCVLAQQQVSAEQYLREWAAWLRGQEQELQARMRWTCVAVSPHPNALANARRAAQAAAASAMARVRQELLQSAQQQAQQEQQAH